MSKPLKKRSFAGCVFIIRAQAVSGDAQFLETLTHLLDARP